MRQKFMGVMQQQQQQLRLTHCKCQVVVSAPPQHLSHHICMATQGCLVQGTLGGLQAVQQEVQRVG
jgi:hypothetical protein